MKSKLPSLIIILCLLLPLNSRGQTRPDSISIGKVFQWLGESDSDFWQAAFARRYLIDTTRVEGYFPLLSKLSPISDAVEFSWRYDIRADLYDQATELLGLYSDSGLLLEDPFLDDYLQLRLNEIYPDKLPPGRTGVIQVKVVLDAAPFSYSLANGTVLLNSGLISQLRTQDELNAVLAHELAHVLLDHQVEAEAVFQQNQQELERRARRRAAAASVLTAAAAAISTKRSGGSGLEAFTAAAYTGAIVGGISSAYSLDRARNLARESGAQFNIEQEAQADLVAQAWLQHSGKSSQTITAALSRIQGFGASSSSGSELHMLMDAASPSARIEKLVGGGVRTFTSRSGAVVTYGSEKDEEKIAEAKLLQQQIEPEFDLQITNLLLISARLALDVNRDPDLSLGFLTRVLSLENPPAESYVLASRIQRLLANTAEANEQAWTHIQNAKEVSSGDNWELLIEEALVAQRMGNYEIARDALQQLLKLPLDRQPFDHQWIQIQIEKIPD